MKNGTYNKVPYMVGFNSAEGILFVGSFKRSPKLLETYYKNFIDLIPRDLKIKGGRYSKDAKALSSRIRDFYFGPKKMSEDTIGKLINFFTDSMYLHGIVESVRLHSAANATAYLYRFSFDGALNLMKRLTSTNIPGACHGDEMGYLFYVGKLISNSLLKASSPEIQVIQRMVLMWTNFAKYGNPTPPGPKNSVLGINWQPVKEENATESIPYLNIGSSLESKYNPEQDRLTFWDNIYDEYNGKSMP